MEWLNPTPTINDIVNTQSSFVKPSLLCRTFRENTSRKHSTQNQCFLREIIHTDESESNLYELT